MTQAVDLSEGHAGRQAVDLSGGHAGKQAVDLEAKQTVGHDGVILGPSRLWDKGAWLLGQADYGK